jgi:hypothetical protein
MHKRSLLIAWSVACLVLGTASSAEAKGEGHVRVDGPGLVRSIVIRDPAEVASLFWGAGLGDVDRMDAPGPKTTWGPRFELEFRLWGDGGPSSTLIQRVYPFAEMGRYGMWAFTPSGQHWAGGQRVVAGWWLVAPDAERVLRAHGFPWAAQATVSSSFRLL